MRTIRLATSFVLFASLASVGAAADPPESAKETRPKVAGKLRLKQKSRVQKPEGSGRFEVEEREVVWEASKTAIIICDMWDNHWCTMAAQRVGVMAPRMNAVISAARANGVMIIHAPSDTMEFYAKTPYRARMQTAPKANAPTTIERWRKLDPSKEPPLPIDDSDGGCDDPVPAKSHRAWSRQHPAIDIIAFDGVTDSGEEVYNFCRQEGIENLLVMGVHTNMCVLGRSFGIRQMTQLGMNVALVRDLTDAMYDPRDKPNVSHTRGTNLVIEHIETYWCPSILSDDLLTIVPGSAEPAKKPGEL